MVDSKTYGVLLIENDCDSRSYYSAALNGTGIYSVKIAANSEEAFYIIEAAQRDELKFIIINSNLAGDNFCVVLQELKKHSATFLTEVILISNDVDDETKYLLEELSIKSVFKQQIEAKIIIDYLDDLRNENINAGKFDQHIYEFNLAIKNKDLMLCQEYMDSENFRLFLMSSEQYISLYGEYLILKKDYQECHDLLNKAIKAKYSLTNRFATVSVLNCLAKSLCYLEKFDEALMIYAQMATKSPKNLNHKLNVSDVHLSNGRWQSALNVIDVVLKQDPKNKDALLKCVQAKVGLGRLDEAKAFMDKIAGTTELNSLVSFYNNRGVAFARKQEYEKALEFYKNALFFCDKESSKVVFNIGICLLKFNHYEEAIKIFTDLQKLDEFGSLYEHKSVLKNILKE